MNDIREERNSKATRQQGIKISYKEGRKEEKRKKSERKTKVEWYQQNVTGQFKGFRREDNRKINRIR